MMKKSILAVVATTAAVVSFSCKQEKQPEPELVSSAVEITLGASSSSFTKADGDISGETAFGTPLAAFFEKEVHNIVMFVYESEGANKDVCVYQHEFSDFELKQKKAVFQIPGMKAVTKYDFYAIANCTASKLGNLPTRTTLLEVAEGRDVPGQSVPTFSTLLQYNADYETVIEKAYRNNYQGQSGFIMSGMKTETTQAAGANKPTKVKVELRRTVAKVMIDIKVTDEFRKKYPESKMQFTKAALDNLTKTTPLIARTQDPVLGPGDRRGEKLEQVPHSEVQFEHYRNLFYIYENGVENAPEDKPYDPKDETKNEGLRPVLILTGLFDYDGDEDPSTLGQSIRYTIKLSGDGDSDNTSDSKFGLFRRNGSYMVNVSVNGLDENMVVAEIEVMDWETLKTQEISIGDQD